MQPTFHFCRLVTVGTSLIIDRVFFGEVSCFKLIRKRLGLSILTWTDVSDFSDISVTVSGL